MKIIHAGGYAFIVEPLVAAQELSSHRCLSLLSDGGALFEPACGLQQIYSRIEEVRAFQPEVVHLHSLKSLSFAANQRTSAAKLLKAIKSMGAVTLLQTCPGDYEYCSDAFFQELEDCLPLIDYILVASPDMVAHFSKLSCWHRFALPVELEDLSSSQPPFSSQGRELKILCLERGGNSQEDIKQLSEIINRLSAPQNAVSLRVLKSQDLASRAGFLQELEGSDIFFDSLRRFWPSEAGVLAMAAGRQIILGEIDKELPWPQLELSSIIFTSAAELPVRLSGILREPKCLRDYGKRAREYALTYHNLSLMTPILLGLYERQRGV